MQFRSIIHGYNTEYTIAILNCIFVSYLFVQFDGCPAIGSSPPDVSRSNTTDALQVCLTRPFPVTSPRPHDTLATETVVSPTILLQRLQPSVSP